MTRKIFAELNRCIDVRPICWNTLGDSYAELGEAEYRFPTQPFQKRSQAVARSGPIY